MDKAGIYLGIAESCGMDTAATGSSGLDITYKVTQEAIDGEWVDLEEPFSRRVTIWLPEDPKPKYAEMVEERFDFVGFNGDFKKPEVSAEPVTLQCKEESYEGRAQAKWELYTFTPHERTAPEPASLRKLAAKYKYQPKPKVAAEDTPF